MDHISCIKWDLIFFIKFLFDKDFRTIFNKNKRFKNLYSGKRCFIVGNGPSLKKMDLTPLSNEITFTVNHIMLNQKVYDSIQTDYHVFIDPAYNSLKPDIKADREKIEALRTINYPNKKPVCLTSYEIFSAIQKFGLNDHLDLAYLYQHRTLTNSYSGYIDLSRNIPSSQNVIQAAIFAAIYMNFKEIYLVGCDMTSIFLTFESNDDGNREISKDFHVYKYSSHHIQTAIKNSNKYDNEYMLNDYAKTFAIFKRIKNYTERKGIKIMNATLGGGLDVFDRVRYKDLFLI
jgi:hypothetical protein